MVGAVDDDLRAVLRLCADADDIGLLLREHLLVVRVAVLERHLVEGRPLVQHLLAQVAARHQLRPLADRIRAAVAHRQSLGGEERHRGAEGAHGAGGQARVARGHLDQGNFVVDERPHSARANHGSTVDDLAHGWQDVRGLGCAVVRNKRVRGGEQISPRARPTLACARDVSIPRAARRTCSAHEARRLT